MAKPLTFDEAFASNTGCIVYNGTDFVSDDPLKITRKLYVTSSDGRVYPDSAEGRALNKDSITDIIFDVETVNPIGKFTSGPRNGQTIPLTADRKSFRDFSKDPTPSKASREEVYGALLKRYGYDGLAKVV